MRIILDENLPISLAGSFTGHEVVHVEQLGWKSIKNGDLLRRISGQYDAFLTGDTNLQYQQNLAQFDVAVVLPFRCPVWGRGRASCRATRATIQRE